MLTDPERSISGGRVENRFIGYFRLRERGRTSVQTVQTVGAGILGCAYLVYLITATSSFTSFGRIAAPWWLPIMIVAVVGSGFALIAVSATGRTDRLRPTAYACALGYLLAMGLWFVARDGATTGDVRRDATITVWFTMLPELACLALVLARRPVLAAVNLVVAAPLGEAVAAVGRYGEYGDLDSIVRTVWTIAWGMVFLTMGATAVAFARRLDETRSATNGTIRAPAREDARAVERRRLDALVHDRIIVCLLALRPGIPDGPTVAAAAAVLHELDHWWDASAGDGNDLDARSFVQRLRTVASRHGDDVAVRADISASPTTLFPADAADALLDATAEAVRNYRRHAGADAACIIVVVVSDDDVTITVVDDGVGFHPDDVPPGRLGMAFGITGRLDSVAGGSSSILSAPAHGTRVRLRWGRP